MSKKRKEKAADFSQNSALDLQRSLAEVKLGEWATIKQIKCCPKAKRRFMDLGLISGTAVQAVLKSPCGDPTAFYIRGTVIALRRADCRHIFVY